MNFDIYIEYIKNTGGEPLIKFFDDDWEPIGPMVRRDMLLADVTRECDGKVFLMPDGGF